MVKARRVPAMVLVAVALLAPRGVRGDDAVGADAEVPAKRPWSVYATTGLVYDSNVTLDPSGQAVPGAPTDPEDGAVTFGAGGRYDLLDTERWEASLEYGFYQTLHFRLDDYNLRSNLVQGTVGYALLPELWTGVQTGYQHYALGGSSYSGEPFVTPFVSLVEESWGLTQLLYRHGEVAYHSPPFEDVRDGPSDAASLSQTIYWGAHYATVGYEFGSYRPNSHSVPANDYRYNYNQAYVGVGFAPGWATTVDLMYLFQYENYTEPNSVADFKKKRHDSVSQFYVGVRRPIVGHLTAGITYYGTLDDSNIDVYQYRRNVVAAELRFSY